MDDDNIYILLYCIIYSYHIDMQRYACVYISMTDITLESESKMWITMAP